MKKITLTTLMIVMFITLAFGQKTEQDPTYRKFYIGSTFTMLGNFVPGPAPKFVQLNAGYRITPKDVISIEAKTIEPSISMTDWPIRTNVPESYAILESKWANYFFPEPGLHFGFKF